ncbi:unnamed protein product [Rangifer tarandus platyrhynchus]|uniref:Uncharacterized protein n=1 Tax=Rangifer tarandus platyrhynchus TaxID=3082113 RepID=A0ABN8YJ95_RANTA|nr:unnamed protein product [Rangifer tarandus platyrhynchus]
MNAGRLVPWGRREDGVQEAWKNYHLSLPWLYFLIPAHSLQPRSCRARSFLQSCLECPELYSDSCPQASSLFVLPEMCGIWNFSQVVESVVVKPEGRGQGTTFKRMTEPEDTT